MKAAVTRMASEGVPRPRLSRANGAGRRPSWLMAIMVRLAARMPALPVVRKAAIAASASTTAPAHPHICSAACESGAGRHPAGSAGSTPTVTSTTAT